MWPVATAAMGNTSAANNGQRCWHFQFDAQHRGHWHCVVTTLVTRHTQASQADLVWHMSKFNFTFNNNSPPTKRACEPHGNWQRRRIAAFSMASFNNKVRSSVVYGFRFCVLVCLVCAALALLFKKVGQPTRPIAAIDDVGGQLMNAHSNQTTVIACF